MLTRRLSIALAGFAVLSLTASTAFAESLTDRLHYHRMTVLRVDRDHGRVECAEHGQWTSVSRADLRGVSPGDIVQIESRRGQTARLYLVRTAAEELSSPE
jgi:hypothetical protein